MYLTANDDMFLMKNYNTYKDTHFLPLKRTLRRFCIVLNNAILHECPTRIYNKLKDKLSLVCVNYEDFLREYLLEFHQEGNDGDDEKRWSNMWEDTSLIVKSADNNCLMSTDSLMFITKLKQTVLECSDKLCDVDSQYEVSEPILKKFNKFIKSLDAVIDTLHETFQ
jgi:hypothetical protein